MWRSLRSLADAQPEGSARLTWSIEVVGVTGDESVVTAVVAAEGYELTERHDGNSVKKVLRHEKYQPSEDASAINADAQQLADRLARFAAAQGLPLGIAFGPVQRVGADGSTSKHIFVQATSAISITCTATATVLRNPDISEEERVRLENELTARAAAHKRQALIRRGQAAMKDGRVLDLMELMKVEALNPTQMGHIVDLVRDMCGGNLNAFASRKEVERFDRSINHPTVMGLDSRHAVSREQPPPWPMTISEAGEFARRIGAAWLAQLDTSST